MTTLSRLLCWLRGHRWKVRPIAAVDLADVRTLILWDHIKCNSCGVINTRYPPTIIEPTTKAEE